jgi:hypothetical protein
MPLWISVKDNVRNDNERVFEMDDIFDEAWSAARRMMGREVWERLPDAVRVHAAYEQICKMDAEQMQGRPLFEDGLTRSP